MRPVIGITADCNLGPPAEDGEKVPVTGYCLRPTLLKAFEKRELDPERLFISLGRVLKLKSRIVKGKDKPRLDLNAIGGAEQTQLVAELTREIEKKRLRLPRAL